MRTISLLAVSAALAMTASCGAFAPQYPAFGHAAYRIEGLTAAPAGGPVTNAVIYRDGPKMRIEATLAHYGRAIVVFDQSTNAAYVLNPTAPSNTSAPPAVTAAPRVAGVAVRLADVDAPQPLETPWAALGADNARAVGACTVAGVRGHEWRPKDAPAPGVERTACITADGIVLRVRENQRVLFEATHLQRGPQPAALFGVPPGYQLIDPEAVAEGVGARMENLNSVTGAPTAQTPPPHG